MAISIDIKDQATEAIKRLGRNLRPSSIGPVAGRAAVNLIQENFRNLEQTRPNKLGGDRTHFWNQAAKSTQFQEEADGVRVSVNQVGVRQRLQGGVIRPKNSKYLTIPAIAEAYGRRAREFHNLRLVFLPSGPALIKAEANAIAIGKKGIKNKGSVGGEVMYWLRKSVRQAADPTVIPSEAALRTVILSNVENYLARLTERRAA